MVRPATSTLIEPGDAASSARLDAAALFSAGMAEAPEGFELSGVARAGRRFVLYAAERTRDGNPVWLKTPRHERASARDLAVLAHEVAVLTRLTGAPVVSALGMLNTGSRPWLVLDNPGGESLSENLARFRAPARAVALCASIARALAEVHRLGVVHRDLKPHHVLVLGDGSVKLTGFRRASLLRVDSAVSTMHGTLAYMAPEQTGRMNRSVDKRADLYALGITFYELLTGRLPFEANDPLEWVHAHLAKVPVAPSKLDDRIPGSFDAIVLKLLSKHPEDRYQGAAGLERDLERCASALARGATSAFALGSDDIPDDFRVARRLYGRRDEVARLIDGFDRARSSGSCVVSLVGGFSGVGKSSLVGELYQPIVRERGRFVSGKFDQYKRDIPYATMVQAFRDLLRGLLAVGEESLAGWRERLRDALGVNGRLIVDVIPELELIIGPQPPVLELDPVEGQRRFELVFSAFVRVFARAEHPLVIFLDDMQWADGATLGLLKVLARPGQFPHLHLVLAFRSNEVGPAHPFQRAVDAMRAEGASIDSIELRDLEPEHVLQLVADTVSRRPDEAAALAAVIGAKAGGNPFFIGELLQVLHARGLLWFDVASRGWAWREPAIQAVDVTENVVDLLIDRIRGLSPETRRTLTLASCFGSRFDLGTLAAVAELSLECVEAALYPALADGLVVAVNDEIGEARSFRFQHDRIQQAAYSFDVEQRADAHLRIGRVLRERFAAGADDVLFDAVKHLDHAAALVVEPIERQQLVALSLLAGRRAKAASAWEPARVYLESAASLAGDEAWTTNYATTFAVLRELAECEFLTGQFAAAEARFDELRRRSTSRAARGEVANSQVRLYIVMGRYDEAVRLGLAELLPFGEPLETAEEDLEAAIGRERERLSANLAGMDLRAIVHLPTIEDPEPRALIVLLTSMAPAVYSRRPSLFPMLAMRTVNLSLEHGNCEHSCFGYSIYAMMLASREGDPERALRMSEVSIALNERFRDPKLRGTVLHIHANHIVFWRRPFSAVSALQEAAYLAAREVGDLTIVAYVSFMGGWQCLARGESLSATERALSVFEDIARVSQHAEALLIIRAQRQFARALAGLTKSHVQLSDAEFDADQAREQMAHAGFDTGLVMHDLLRAMLAWHHGEFVDAESWLARGSVSLPAASALPLETTWSLFDALTAAALWTTAAPDARAALAVRVERAELRLRGWARGCPENFGAEHALVVAELLRMEERFADALHSYEKAADAARESGLLHLEATAARLALRLATAQGLSRATRSWLRDAHEVLATWQAAALVRTLEAENPELRVARTSAGALVSAPEQLDVLTAIKTSQALSRETTIEGLTQALLRVVLEHAGAERAVVMLARGDALGTAEAASVDGRTSSEVSESVVRYVERTRSLVVLADAVKDPTFGGDTYLVRNRVRSVLCLPILVHSQLALLLYLENNLIAGAFSTERVALLEVVSTQLAISLTNATLYAERQERAEQAARQEASTAAAMLERSKLAALFEQAPAAILVLEGPRHMVTLANAPYLLLVGQRPLRGRELRDALPEAAGQGYIELLDRLFVTGERHEGHESKATVLRGPNGAPEDIYVNIVYQPFRDAEGNVQGIMIFAFEVTDLVHARDERQTLIRGEQLARSEAEAANRSKDEFLAMLGHELRNPLAPIVTALHVLELRDGDRNERERAIIERQVTHLVRLVDDLLDVSRITSGKIELKRARVELAEVVSKAIELASPLLEQRRHVLTVDVPRYGMAIDCDLTRMAQVVSNLLANAAKYTEPGGRVAIVATRVGESVELRVRDTGIGIVTDMLPRVFDLFTQESQALSRAQGGLGLGLAIVRSLVGMHGGTVAVHSDGLGRGSEFTVRLPAVPLRGSVVTTAAAANLPSLPTARVAVGLRSDVLIVDDNEEAAEMLAAVLEGWGFRVRLAHDGPAALRLVAEFIPAIVLLDIGLPVIDGYEVARLFKQDPRLHQTRLVALTGYGQASDRLRTKTAGFDVHLVKPVDLTVLQVTMLSWSEPSMSG